VVLVVVGSSPIDHPINIESLIDMYTLSCIFLIFAFVLFLFTLILDEFAFFIGACVSAIFAFMFLSIAIDDEKIEKALTEKNLKIASLVESSGLNIVNISGKTAYLECIHMLTSDKIKLEILIVPFEDQDQLVVQKSNSEIIVFNKDNIERFYPDIDCLVKV
jgi:hypothetical protein